jgi:(1->4)-alpha-D-glucan 1-alpha-D-glucosylmutase
MQAHPIVHLPRPTRSRSQFRRLADLLPYLEELGIGAVYLSPILATRSGSTHGYDVVDHDILNPELGSEEDVRES